MVMHPIKPALDGKDVGGVTDPAGTHVFLDIVHAGNEPGAVNYVHYLWPKPGAEQPVRKTSVVKRFAPWDWYLVTGMYDDDVQAAVIASMMRWLGVLLVFGAISTVALMLVLRSVRKSLGGALEDAVTVAQQIGRAHV